MKKLIITSIVVLTCFSAFAQFEKGRILAGGNVGFSTHKYKSKSSNTTVTTGKSTSFNFSPKVGYFFINNLAAGLGVDLSSSTYKSEGSDEKDTYTGFGITPFVRYYLKPGIYFQGDFGVGPYKHKNVDGNVTTTSKYTSSRWSLGAGYAYFLNSNVAIEPFIGYQSTTDNYSSPDYKNLDSGLFINIGLQVYLDPKK